MKFHGVKAKISVNTEVAYSLSFTGEKERKSYKIGFWKGHVHKFFLHFLNAFKQTIKNLQLK